MTESIRIKLEEIAIEIIECSMEFIGESAEIAAEVSAASDADLMEYINSAVLD